MTLSVEDKEWFDEKFKKLYKALNDLEIKADKSFLLATAVSKKVLN